MGVKTGSSSQAGGCLAFAATLDRRRRLEGLTG